MSKLNKITDPHDRYFKVSMSDIRVAREFFEFHLPTTILSQLNLSTLRSHETSFISSTLSKSLVDMLYSVEFTTNGVGYLYLIVEHQRTAQRLMPYRLMQYVFQIMDHHLKQHNTEILPIVVPTVLYNGEKPYFYDTDIFNLFGDYSELAKSVLLQPFNLVDLTQISDETIRQMHWAGILEFAQKHIDAQNLNLFIKEIVHFLKYLEKAEAHSLQEATLEYLFQGNIDDHAQFATIVSKEVSTVLGVKAMSLAERLKQEGFLEGKVEGKAEGKHEASIKIAQRMLKEGVDPAFVAKATELNLEAVKALSEVN